MSRLWIAVLVGVLAGAACRAADEAADAKVIVEKAGVRVGLCLHLGCGQEKSPGLTAALAENSNMLVHGLAADDAALARARKAIETRNMAGRAMVECVPLKPLPYLPDLADLVVVEDLSALTARGATRDDILRVVAPGGALCVREGGQWTKTVKPRPAEMDEWTHPHHGADGNLVSTDKLVKFPLGFRWIDGLPMNVNRWASCRSWVVAGGRVFMISSNQLENLAAKQKPYYLAAHDAWNGLPLWKINLETNDDGAFLTWVNEMPVATDGVRVFAGTKDKCIGVDAATGQIAVTFPTKFPPAKLALSDGILVATCWQMKVPSKAKFDRLTLWATWVPLNDAGSVEAFDAKTGALKWSLPVPAQTVLVADGVAYLLLQKGNPITERTVVAVELATGKERWRVPHTRFGEDPDLQLNVAAKGYVVVSKIGDITGLGAPKKEAGEKPKEKAIFVLAAADGKNLWQISPSKSIWTPVVNGLLWYQSNKYDALTGQMKGNIGWGLGDQFCTPQAIVGNILTRTRGGQYIELPGEGGGGSKDLRYAGARGACMQGMVSANGMFYTAQNNCACTPGQVYGFVAVGPCGEIPAAADFEKARPVEKGPAFGAAAEELKGADDWPAFRHDAERSGASAGKIPENLRKLWEQPAAAPAAGPLAQAWQSRLASCLTAPVSAGGLVLAAGTDAGQVVALNAADGKKLWSTMLGGRIDTPPTIHQGLCLVGCHDGWLYALRAKDGQLAWRARIAPWERKMVAYGEIESVWPAVGTVLIHENVAYANAGRTSDSDGGIAVVALNPATGEHVWGKAIGAGQRMNDMLALRGGQIGWYNVRLDAKTGENKPAATAPKDPSMSGMMDGSWTLAPFRRSGNGYSVGKTTANLLAWSETVALSPAAAIARDKESNVWQSGLPRTQQVEALALCANAALYAGRMTDAAAGKPAGFLIVVSLADGKKLAEFPLDAPPTYDGLAVANEKVFVSLQNGNVVCFGK